MDEYEYSDYEDDQYDEYDHENDVWDWQNPTLEMRWWRFKENLKHWFWANFTKCDRCKRLHRDCDCIPF